MVKTFNKLVSIVLLVSSAYYLFQYLLGGHTGAVNGFSILFCSSVIVYFALVEEGKPWFKRKDGKGPVVSVGWQGYLTLALWALLTVLVFWSVDQNSHSVSDTLINIMPTEVLLYVTLILVYFKKLEGN